MNYLTAWTKRRSKLFDSKITVKRFNSLLNDHDLGLFGGGGEVIRDLKEVSDLGTVALMAGCKSAMINLGTASAVQEIFDEAGVSCQVIEKE